VLVLLPPSEGKTPAPDPGSPIDLAGLTHPGLTTARTQVLRALIAASARPDAVELLGVSPGLANEVARNVSLRTAASAPAAQVYTGVLFAAAGLAGLDGAASARAASDIVVISALWGALSPVDAIPAYRLAMGTDLPPLGRLAAFWRPHLATALDPRAAGDVVVDCRSAPYAAAWRPPVGTDWVAVRVVREVDGIRSVVSHHAKHTRGVLVRHLVTRATPVHSAGDLDEAARELVGTVLMDAALHPATSSRGPATLELVVP
jgi:cytoplasmic iron level regulating protein YaaA (DUF328/UPF0246 family)